LQKFKKKDFLICKNLWRFKDAHLKPHHAELKPAFDGAPTMILGPGDMTLAHQTDEYCAVDRIEEAANIYEAIARRWGEM